MFSFNILSNRLNVMKKSSAQKTEVAERAARCYKLNPAKKNVLKAKSKVSGYVSPLVTGMKEDSVAIGAISSAVSATRKNMRAAKRAAKEANKSVFKASLKGLADSKDVLVNSLKEISGVNDIVLARKNKGVMKAVAEGGKSLARLVSSGSLFVACTLIPIPALEIFGWYAGEKFVEKLLGKPFSKRLRKLK